MAKQATTLAVFLLALLLITLPLLAFDADTTETAVSSGSDSSANVYRSAVKKETASQTSPNVTDSQPMNEADRIGKRDAVNTTTGQSSFAEAAPEHAFGWAAYIQAIGVLLLLLGALYIVLWLFKRYGSLRGFGKRLGAARALELEEQFHFAPKKSLVVVRFLDKRLLLGVTDQQITLLSENDANHEPEQANFRRIMDSARGENS